MNKKVGGELTPHALQPAGQNCLPNTKVRCDRVVVARLAGRTVLARAHTHTQYT